ncbi:MAG: hypothetical protein ACK559_14165, partial [bacterium]
MFVPTHEERRCSDNDDNELRIVYVLSWGGSSGSGVHEGREWMDGCVAGEDGRPQPDGGHPLHGPRRALAGAGRV